MKITIQILLIPFVMLTLFSCNGIEEFNKYVLHKKAETAHKRGQLENAIIYYTQYLKIVPRDTLVHYDLCIAYLDSGNLKMARRQIELLRKFGEMEAVRSLETLLTKKRLKLQAKMPH